MDYKSTYYYFFNKTQDILSLKLRNYLIRECHKGRSFSLLEPKIIETFDKKIDTYKIRSSADKFESSIKLINQKDKYYSKNAIAKILSNEIKEEYLQLPYNSEYRSFLSQLAITKAVLEAQENYTINSTYFSLLYKTDGIEEIHLKKIPGTYTSLKDYNDRHDKFYKIKSDNNSKPSTNRNKNPEADLNYSNSILNKNEKLLLLGILFSKQQPISQVMSLSEYAKVMNLVSDGIDDKILEKPPSNVYSYTQLHKYSQMDPKDHTKNDLFQLILKLKNLKIKSLLGDAQKLLSKTN